MKPLFEYINEATGKTAHSYDGHKLTVRPGLLGSDWEMYAQGHDLDEEYDNCVLIFDWDKNTVDVTLPNILTNMPAKDLKFHCHCAKKFSEAMSRNGQLKLKDFSCRPTKGAEELVDTILGIIVYIFNEMPEPLFESLNKNFVIPAKMATALLPVLQDIQNEDKPIHEFLELMIRVKNDIRLLDIIKRFDNKAGYNNVIYTDMPVTGPEAGMIAVLLDFMEKDHLSQDGYDMAILRKLRSRLKFD
jgi:hypothetical protein